MTDDAGNGENDPVQQTLGGQAATNVVNQHNTDQYDVDIGRADNGTSNILNTEVGEPGWIGNPYRLSDGYSREESIRRFRGVFVERLKDDEFRRAVEKLRGRTLACYCKPDACHGDVIVEYLNTGSVSRDEHRSPDAGGCWVCKTGNGYEDEDMAFDTEFDTFYHPDCLDAAGVDSVLDYEQTS